MERTAVSIDPERRAEAVARGRRALLATAYHEAGHAVAAHVLGRPLLYATIIPEDLEHAGPSNGHVHYGKTMADSKGEGWGLMMIKMVCACAGPAAHRRHDPRAKAHLSGGYDYETVKIAASLVSSSEAAERALRRWGHEEARQLVRRHWSDITALAHRLLVEFTMTGMEITAFLKPLEEARATAAREYRESFTPEAFRQMLEAMREDRYVERRRECGQQARRSACSTK